MIEQVNVATVEAGDWIRVSPTHSWHRVAQVQGDGQDEIIIVYSHGSSQRFDDSDSVEVMR